MSQMTKQLIIPECQKCGNCCMKGVMVDLEEAKKLIEKYPNAKFHHLTPDKDFPSKWCVSTTFSDEGCTFLKGNLCSIHLERPTYCRQFPFEDSKISPEIHRCKFYSKCFGINKEDKKEDK